jgi:flagellar hook-associated protein 1 FlgK
MVTLFGIFETGARALFSQQIGLDTTGHNIANANTPGFSRQRTNFSTTNPISSYIGSLPTGVQVQSVTRLRDEFLDFQIRQQTSLQGFHDENEGVYTNLQYILQDPLNPIADLVEQSASEAGLSSLLKRFFNAFQELSLNPESNSIRASVRQTATTLAQGLNTIHDQLSEYQAGLNDDVATTVTEINSLIEQIASINQEVIRIETNEKRIANDARDLRDQLLTQLSDLVPISTTEQPNGAVDVRVMNTTVVIGNRAAPFEAVVDPEDDTGTYEIINSVERSRVLTSDFTAGRLGAILQARDTVLPDKIEKVNEIARVLIREVNRAHSTGTGLVGFSELLGTTQVSDAAVPLDNLQFDFPADAGTLTFRIVDSNGTVQNVLNVAFDPSTDSLNDLAANIDAADGLAGAGNGPISAEVTPEGQLRITTNGGLQVTIGGDSSGVLSTLGINTFFAGGDASDIAISDFIGSGDEGLLRIAASANGEEGDNGTALILAGLEHNLIANGNRATLGDFYRSMISELGVQAQQNKTLAGNANLVVENLVTRQESVAGVSLDEESVNLIRFQQAYNASARFITTLDSLLDRVVNGMGVTR